jgi:hypothetical protein
VSRLYLRRWSEAAALNERITARVFAERRRFPACNIVGSTAWSSAMDLHRWQAPETDALFAWMREQVAEAWDLPYPWEQVHAVAWANVAEQGAFTAPHDHHLADWAAVYYASAPDGSGRLVLDGHPSGAPSGAIPPEPGLLLIFPATWRHRVEPTLSAIPRVSIAANFHSRNFENMGP